ncbi:Tetrathionate reductase subunit B precursor [Botrimarina colliarenosi]|uniref:Tetrathionate reductase subunit B n=1 Tax=Botrimarina colliarenosi TaxID=2528001 RepID=A0A5C6AIH9_9BACT|nr:TAT-variant-translocated molybdopterin oxidoreductase [Botrimarina colliarenosi]TWT99862.1 Tetrathionate reductase subunit B precursor [Botrimarina colliarenosi]
MTQATENPVSSRAASSEGPASSRVSPYWRSLDELQSTDAFQEFLAREFPQSASEFPEGVSRRRWMQLMSASFALAGAAGCRWETDEITPFANRPEGYIPGTHQHYATNIHWAGAPRHLLVTKFDERPVKIEGNPDHPASRGAADSFTQAATLALYDPDRATAVQLRDGSQKFGKNWNDFESFLDERLGELGDGAELAILTPSIDSHTFYAALDRVKDKYPAAKFYRHDAISRENELAGAELAFGQRVRSNYRLSDAKVIATFDADLLTAMPDSMRAARDYAEKRDPDGEMNRLWSVESFFSPTGAAADHRLPLKSSAIGGYLAQLRDKVKELAAGDHDHGDAVEGEPTPEQFLAALADDLVHNQGTSVVVVGPGQPAAVHAIGHEINGLLGNVGKTVVFTEEPKPRVEVAGIDALLTAMKDEQVNTLLVLDGNPGYDAPGFAEAVEKVPHTVRLGVYDDETSRACKWSLPQTHPLEEWGDVIAWDGTVGVCQPMIEPLLDGRSVVELLALVAGDRSPNARQMVADALGEAADVPGEAAWNKMLYDGLLADSAAEPVDVGQAKAAPELPASAGGDDAIELVFVPSSSTYDGRLANSGWLQETPDFLTKLTWDNAALVSPATAEKLGLQHGKTATLSVGETSVTAPVYVMPGQAAGSIAIALGYGRTAAGRVGGLVDPESGKAAEGLYANDLAALWIPAPADPVGVDIYPLRGAAMTGFIAEGVEIKSLGKDYLLATTQDHHAIDALGLEAIGRRTSELIRTASLDHYEEHPKFAPEMSHEVMVHVDGEHRPTEPLWKLKEYKGDYAWGMSIDLGKCIGCNACMVACQAENNVPVVGKDQVSKGREMHWIRIDRYFKGTANLKQADDPENFVNPQVAHQPLTCQQCETAPCEEVCPVAATVHDAEGLNGMVYNRCIGTRYCSNNCPYKVRRFNYFRYTKKLYEASNELQKLVINPEVTVRSRGVMEKCTFCVQRISAARITAKNEGRSIQDGEVVSACAQACPTRAIEFGDLRDESSKVSKAHASDRAYGILTELMTNPRNLFLAKVRNPHPMLARPDLDPAVHGHGHDEHEGHEEGHSDEHDHEEAHA